MSRFVSPAPFDVACGIEYLLMAVVGGAGSILGGVVGAAVVPLLKNSSRTAAADRQGASGQLEVVAFAVLFILLLQRARGGHRARSLARLSAASCKQSRPPAADARCRAASSRRRARRF